MDRWRNGRIVICEAALSIEKSACLESPAAVRHFLSVSLHAHTRGSVGGTVTTKCQVAYSLWGPGEGFELSVSLVCLVSTWTFFWRVWFHSILMSFINKNMVPFYFQVSVICQAVSHGWCWTSSCVQVQSHPASACVCTMESNDAL